MKILICGKGGSGKSTLAVLTAGALAKKGYRILLVDADESNLGLARLLGLADTESISDKLGGKKGAKNKMMTAFSSGMPVFMNKKWRFDDIPPDFYQEKDNIRLLTIGKIHHFGEGCACAMGGMSKTLLSNLHMEKDEIVIVDTEAGIEHLGRGVGAGGDLMLVVVDPSYDSFLLARKIDEIGQCIDKSVRFVLNKTDAEVEELMRAQVDRERIIACIPETRSVFRDALLGKSLENCPRGIEHICGFIDQYKSVPGNAVQ
ncbi:MAG: P-loop NTPase [Desulfococcaceae bacterium]|jgi:CO dehydrogenase maturation factor|nr:P-loop NTPase [Desulfococcaceae bacterium]